MLFNKFFLINFNLLLIIELLNLNIFLCQKLSSSLLGGWGEKLIDEKSPDFISNLDIVKKYLEYEEYSLKEIDIIPFGYFKQIVNGVNYRILCAVKKKSNNSPSFILDIITHKSNNEIKMISSKNLEYSSSILSEKVITQMKNAIYKYYSGKFYHIKDLEIQYEYHNLDGLQKYAIYDVSINLNYKNENLTKRVLIIYRNEKTFTVEEELNAE